MLRALTPPLRTLFVYRVKVDEANIYISISGGVNSDAAAEIVFSGKAQPGLTASDVNIEEVTTFHFYPCTKKKEKNRWFELFCLCYVVAGENGG